MTDIERWLRVFCQPGQVVELRALNVHGKRAVCEVHGDLSALAQRAAELDAAGAVGVYFTPNPIRPDLAGWKNSRLKAEDVIERRWLLIDADTWRPAGTNATEAELQLAWSVLDRCQSTLDAAGLSGAVVGFSGNGWHLCYPIQLPNDESAHELVKATLKGLHEHCGSDLTKGEAAEIKAGRFLATPKARVDTSPHDAPRIWKLYGTMARKGPNTPERPHRRSFLVELP